MKIGISSLTILLALAFGAQAQMAVASVQVGAVFPMTGGQASFGQESVNGMKLALKKLEADDKTKGQIQLTVEDDKSEPVDAANAVRKLIDVDKVSVIVGSVASSNTMAAAPIAQKAKIPLMTPASTNANVTKQGDYISRICFTDDFQGEVMAKFAKQNLNAKKAAIIVDSSSDYSKGLEKVFRTVFAKLGGTVAPEVFAYQQKDTDFRSLLRNVKKTNPDVIWLPGYYTEVGNILKQARQLGITAPFLGGDGWDSPTLFEMAGDSAKGNYISSHFAPDDTDALVQGFVKDYEAEYDVRPGAMAALGYDAMMVMSDAIKRAGSGNSAAINKAITSTKNFAGITGKITLNAQRDAVKSAVVLETTEKTFVFKTKVNP